MGDVLGTTNFSFEVFNVVDTTASLTLNTAVSASLTTPGEQDNYKFTLSAPTLVWFDSQTNDNNMNWQLTGQQGKLSGSSTSVSMRTIRTWGCCRRGRTR